MLSHRGEGCVCHGSWISNCSKKRLQRPRAQHGGHCQEVQAQETEGGDLGPVPTLKCEQASSPNLGLVCGSKELSSF